MAKHSDFEQIRVLLTPEKIRQIRFPRHGCLYSLVFPECVQISFRKRGPKIEQGIKRRIELFLRALQELSATDPSDWYSGTTSSYIPPSTESSARADTLFASFNLAIYPVLIVDDNEGVCILIARMLSNIGFKSIYIANSAKQAYSIFGTQIAEETADPIIFLDLRLPDVPGEKVAKRIIEVRPSSRIILVTAEDSTTESAQEAMRQGAAAYIQKPIGLAKIKSVLATLIRDMEASKSKEESDDDQGDGKSGRRI